MWRWLVIGFVFLGCKGEPKREITKTMTMTNRSKCVDGDEASCARAGRTWTGSTSRDAETCTDGNEAACVRVGGDWRHGHQLRETAVSCSTDGDEAACVHDGAKWTGSLCCK